MAQQKDYTRQANGSRFVLQGGMNTYLSVDLLPEGQYAYLQNVRRYLDGCIKGRATMGAPVYSLGQIPHTIRRLNDSTPDGPPSGYVRVIGAAGLMYVNATEVASGFSTNPVSLCPFRPNASVQPWMYVGDSSQTVTIAASSFVCAGMVKIRSDGLTYKTGIKEPQAPPVVSTSGTTTTGTDSLPATSIPWTNVGGANPSYNYDQTSALDGTAPVVILTPAGSQTLQLIVTGTATVNGAVHAPGDVGPTGTGPHSNGYPANFTGSGPKIVLGAFTDGSGNVLTGTSPVPLLTNVGAAINMDVPAGAAQFQVGVDSEGNQFSANSGAFSIAWTLVSSAIATKISTLGNVTVYYWGDSPHSGPVATYIWKNPNDVGTGTPRTIGTAAGNVTNNSWQFDSSPENGTVPLQWDTLDSSGTITGSFPVFDPALETEGYQDFNMCVVGSIFVPSAGTYTFTFVNKDQIMVGIGGGATVSGGYVAGFNGQKETVVNPLPLILVTTPDGSGTQVYTTISITFPGPGSYQVEIDYDYWKNTGRCLYMLLGTVASLPPMTANVIPPLPQGVRTDVSYACKYRSSETGAVSNPGPATTPELTPVLDNTVSCEFSNDPQVDKVDYYRQDSGLANYTYVATGPNTNPPTAITDTLSDLAAADNQTMDVDDFEPFPSIDLPKAGVVNVSGGVITWVSGDQFNVRWLAGTVIEIGYPTQLAYSLYTRPTSVTSMYIPGVPDGTNLVYNISEPILAAQPLPYMWGPTDNTAYLFACGDPLRPGTLYYTKGNNPDSAPDTNQIEVTSPSEPLMNGVIVNGIGMVFSTEHAWLIYPTFTTALATVQGVSGQAFNLIQSITNRGLYIPTAICTEAGKNVFFRGKDGIYVSSGGAGSESITDGQLFNLFPHEGYLPSPVQIGPYTVYPPDDTNPSAQKLQFAYGYLYYDYQDVNGVPRTLVYDVAGKGWSVDLGEPNFTAHAPDEGSGANDTVVGGADSTVRLLQAGGSEAAGSIIATGAVNAGDARALKRLGDVFIRALIVASNPISVGLYQNRYQSALAGFGPTTLLGTGQWAPYIIDFTNGLAFDLVDVALTLRWNTNSNTYADLWQPDFIPLPEGTQDRPTDWDDAGLPGNKFVQGLLLEADSFNIPKTFSVQRSDDLALFVPNEVPATFNRQSIKPFTFTPPFLAHSVRIISTDGILWNHAPGVGWRMQWIVKPFPESTVEWQTEMISQGLRGFQHIRAMNIAHQSTVDLTLTLVFDQWPTITLTVPNSAGLQTKTWVQIPVNKYKLVSYRLSSAVPFYLWEPDIEVYVKWWGSTGPYDLLKPFGGPSDAGAEV